jgi:putative transposase
MGRQKYTDEQVINILREGEAGGKIGELCRKYGVSDATYHRWRAK